ncbi:MAG: acyl-CoA dehydrogenase [Chlamydiae bacterium]|nr:MAG: acyl-CoA dehydrogenase [Chlamydiota bacterium]
MNHFLTEEQQMIKETAQEIAVKKIKPIALEYDEKNEFPWDIQKIIAEAGLCGVYIDEEYGGMVPEGESGIMNLVIAVEELSKQCGGISLCLAATALGTIPILLFGNDEQKKKYLPEIASGEKVAAFALTEAGAGSDAGSIQTTAAKDGDSYVLNGTKQWITNGKVAETYVIIAMTDKSRGARGATAFIVEKGTPGFSFGKKEDKMGIRASATYELVFEDCKIPAENILGKVGMGFMVAMKTFDMSRPGVAAQALGIAAGALDDAVDYARQREQFGHHIIANQGLRFLLADMSMKVETSRAIVYAVARSIDSGDLKCAKESAIAKCYASDMAMEVTTDAVQVFGGYGYMKEYPMEKRMRDAKITQIYEGTNQIQRDVIGHQLVKEAASRK